MANPNDKEPRMLIGQNGVLYRAKEMGECGDMILSLSENERFTLFRLLKRQYNVSFDLNRIPDGWKNLPKKVK